ncbi:unnamed protein product [Ilex paraguariensis]|uniref:Uncharacterized protein n=1 Tax=Ilex paraguariensis TaxID=185542 RepID=A0ABC8U7B6_9AQUA
MFPRLKINAMFMFPGNEELVRKAMAKRKRRRLVKMVDLSDPRGLAQKSVVVLDKSASQTTNAPAPTLRASSASETSASATLEKETACVSLDRPVQIGDKPAFLRDLSLAVQTLLNVVPEDELRDMMKLSFNNKVAQALHGLVAVWFFLLLFYFMFYPSDYPILHLQSITYVKAMNLQGQDLLKLCKDRALELTVCKECLGSLH